MLNTEDFLSGPQDFIPLEHDLMYEQPPLPCAVTGYELSRNQPVPPEVQTEVDGFLTHQFNLASAPGIPKDVTRRRISAYMNHQKCWQYLSEEMGMDPHFDATPYQDERAFLLIARDADTGQMLGLCSTILRPGTTAPRADDTYVGVDAENGGRGIGGSLFLLQSVALADRGISTFRVSVWQASEAMIDKLGIDYRVVPPEELSPVNQNGRYLDIHLNRPALDDICEERFGYIPEQNSFPDTYQFVLPAVPFKQTQQAQTQPVVKH